MSRKRKRVKNPRIEEPAVNTRVSHYRRSVYWSPDYTSDHLVIPMTVSYDGVQQVADFSAFVSKNKVSNPNWKVLVAKGQDATNAYSNRGFTYLFPARFNGRDVDNNGRYGSVYVVGTAGTSVDLRDPDATLRDLALKKFKNRLNDKIGHYQALVPAAELRELRGLITSFANESAAFLPKWYNRSIGFVGKELTSRLSRYWLTYSFGVSPLLGEIQDASEAVRQHLARDYPEVRVTGSARDWDFAEAHPTTSGTVNGNLVFHKMHEREISYQYVGAVDLEFLSANDYGALSQFGVQLDSLPSVGWELLPFSWVADYFTTAGDYLEDTFQVPSRDLKYLVLNTKRFTKTTINVEFGPTTQRTVLEQYCSPGGWEVFDFSRAKLATIPRRALRFKTSDEIGKGAVNKLLNLASLLGSRVGKRLPVKFL